MNIILKNRTEDELWPVGQIWIRRQEICQGGKVLPTTKSINRFFFAVVYPIDFCSLFTPDCILYLWGPILLMFQETGIWVFAIAKEK